MSAYDEVSMHRRAALRLGGAWIVFGSLPVWWGCGKRSEPRLAEPGNDFAGREPAVDEPAPEEPSTGGVGSPLERALARTRSNGKPLLVFVVPEPPTASDAFGADVAEALARGGDDLLLDLALCELVCASPSHMAATASVAVAPGAVGLLEREGAALRWGPIPWGRWEEPYASSHPFAHPLERARRNGEALSAALAGSAELLSHRASAAREALGREWVEQLEARLATGQLAPAVSLDHGAAVVRVSQRNAFAPWNSLKREVRAELIDAVGTRVLSRGPAGARWARDEACGRADVSFLPSDSAGVRFDIEERLEGRAPAPRDSAGQPIAAESVERNFILCGMAYGGDDARRFLVYYVDEP